jgi:hypothetical protein
LTLSNIRSTLVVMQADPIAVAVAQVRGIAAAYAQMHRIGRGQALARIADVLRGYPHGRQRILDQTAMVYRRLASDPHGWQVDALALLIEAGADRAATPHGGSGLELDR